MVTTGISVCGGGMIGSTGVVMIGFVGGAVSSIFTGLVFGGVAIFTDGTCVLSILGIAKTSVVLVVTSGI